MLTKLAIITFLKDSLERMKEDGHVHCDFKCPPFVSADKVVDLCKKIDIPCLAIDYDSVSLAINQEILIASEKRR